MLIDDTHQGLLYNPVNDVILPLPQLASSTDNCLWDSADTGTLLFGASLLASAVVGPRPSIFMFPEMGNL